jgi:hypothetical protein
MQTYKILILEDDFEAVSKIMAEILGSATIYNKINLCQE